MRPRSSRRLALAAALALASAAAGAAPAAYDPLATPAAAAPRVLDTELREGGREIPLRLYLPPRLAAPAPVVLFSHGLGGSRAGNAYLGEHWSRRGYAAVFLQHPGSDDSVWRGAPRGHRREALRDAADLESFQLRVRDVPAVLDRLAIWNAAASHALARRLDLARVGMSGHSFGAVTTQAVSGQSYPLGKDFTEPRIDAAVLMSPSGPRRGDPTRAFGGVKIPWLLLTGTLDAAPIGGIDAKSRRAVYPALPVGGKYELVLDGAQHSAFGDRALPGDTQERNPNHHRAILAVTTAFWDAHLRGDAEARRWLDGPQVRAVLEAGDAWQRK
jgi:predicted dienelactone hydrolase